MKQQYDEEVEIQGMTIEPDSMTDEQIFSKYHSFKCIHKMGSQLFIDLLSHPKAVKVLKTLVGPNIKTMHSVVYTKPPGKKGLGPHQDEIYIPTRDQSLCGIWIALDPATTQNGCLWVIPGSHKSKVLYPLLFHSDERYVPNAGVAGFHSYTEDDWKPVVLPSGSAIFFNGYLFHRSLPNVSNGFRRCLTSHYMRAEALLPWNWDGRIKPTPEDNRDIVLIEGIDPYINWKPIEKNLYPWVYPNSITITDTSSQFLKKSNN